MGADAAGHFVGDAAGPGFFQQTLDSPVILEIVDHWTDLCKPSHHFGEEDHPTRVRQARLLRFGRHGRQSNRVR